MCVSDTGVRGRFDVREHERVLSLPLFTRLLYPSSLMPRSLHTPASVSVCLSAAMITRTSETFNHQPCAAVHRNAAIFELSELLTITCSRKNFMVILQRVQELSCWQQTHTHTNRHCGTENVTNFAAQVVTRTYTTPKANTIRDHPRNFQITRPSTIVCVSNQIKSNCTFIRRLLKSDFSQAPPTSMRA